jgi:hypothetical protein
LTGKLAFPEDGDVFDRNLRFLLWRERPSDRASWPSLLSGWTGGDVARAEGLLFGTAKPRPDELARVSAATHHSEDDLAYGDMLAESGIDVLEANVRYLLSTLKHGQQQMLAREIGVHTTTVSRWGGKHKPTRKRLESFGRYFGINDVRELEIEPLFLSMSPISSRQKREWIRDRVSDLPEEDLAALYPAFERLLERK